MSRMRTIREALTPARITLLVIVVIALVFVFENTSQTRIRLLVPEVTMPLWTALLGMGVIGVVCGRFWGGGRK